MNISKFKELPILGILRGITAEDIAPIAETCVSAGLQTIEITMNTGGAPDLIRKMVRESNGRLTVGAGTVLSVEDVKTALDAGATFIVSPVLVRDVVSFCKNKNIPVFPGALTPQEIYEAWEAGATMVKVFPSGFFGPTYFNEIRGPFDRIELPACGGVTAENVSDFFRYGASAVAFGGSIFKKEWLAAKKFDVIEREIKKLVDAVRGVR